MRPRVLVVDDDEAVRTAVSDVLEDEGFDVASARDGEEALGLLQDEAPPSLVLLDLMMPRGSGWDVVDAMKADPRLAHVPLIVLTAFDAATGLPPGTPVMHKPFERDLLVSRVRDVVA